MKLLNISVQGCFLPRVLNRYINVNSECNRVIDLSLRNTGSRPAIQTMNIYTVMYAVIHSW